ncbi:MAG: cation diffusion facilitator family transporter [Bacteroidales bacterium]|nr:cation diffusion facilitator family transporter [Bacteroidales bacterium]
MGHHHSHHKHNNLNDKKLLGVTILNLSITIVQVIGGILSSSLSLLSDALHNLGDSSAIFIAFYAGKKSKQSPNEHRTYGYKRIEILAALFNAMVLIGICFFLFFEAYERFINPKPVHGKIMFIVASFGLLANFISVLILNKNKNHNLNVKAAYLHLLGDTFSSVAVIVGGIFIWRYQIYWIDPIITVFVGVYIIYHTWGIVKQTVDILMQSTPNQINIRKIKNTVEQVPEVDNIHHLHVWQLNDTQIHLEAHINLKNDMSISQMMLIRKVISNTIKMNYKIQHITLQMGYGCCPKHNELIYNKNN